MKAKSDRFHCCRGFELLYSELSGKCPTANFVFSNSIKNHNFRLWTRVCKIHRQIKIPKNRMIILNIPSLREKKYEDISIFMSNVLRTSNSVIKYDALVRQINNTIIIDGRVCVCICMRVYLYVDGGWFIWR